MAETAQKKNLKKWPRRAKGGGQKACAIANCARPYRAKGYCFFHYKKWRHGELPHPRYRTCSKPECRAKATRHGLCGKHYDEAYQTGAAAAEASPSAAATPPAEAAPAPAAPPPAAT